MATHKIWAYGSLREGEYNHKRMRLGKPITTSILKGFDLYDLGIFPACTKGKGKIVAELFEIDEQTFQMIDAMERGEGYYSELATDQMFNQGDIYLVPLKPSNKIVESGDWVEYLNKRNKVWRSK